MNAVRANRLTVADYSAPEEARDLLWKGIIENPLMSRHLPPGTAECAKKVEFEGTALPAIPVVWRFAESTSAIAAYQGAILNVLLKRKYGLDPVPIKINTDHASLFPWSCLLWTIDPTGDNLGALTLGNPETTEKLNALIPDYDIYHAGSSFYRLSATNIYQTKDGKYFHLHGSLNPDKTLDSIDLPHTSDVTDVGETLKTFKEAVGKLDSDELQHRVTDVNRQAGSICYTNEEYKNSEHGKANAHVGLFDIHSHPNPAQQPSWWPDSPQTSPSRPLAGLKILELTRIIAAPVVSRALAELGASVMRVMAPHLPDLSLVHPDTNHGKWNTLLDLRKEEDKQQLRELIKDADVFLEGYRPGTLDKYGFGQKDVLEMCKEREKGIIYARENCYGWNGPWAERTGWQQISDCTVGISHEFGRAMGNDEPVTPVLPNSDYGAGLAGAVGILTALLRRADEGGSFTVDIALNYYSQWLADSCGTYPPEVWQDVWKRHESPVFRHYDAMPVMLPKFLGLLHKHSAKQLFNPSFFMHYHAKNLGKDIRAVAPVLRFPGGEVNPEYHIGTRGNGVDAAKWPEDLSVEIVQ